MFRRATATAITTVTALALSSCTLAAETSEEKKDSAKPGSTVVLVTGVSF